jgi:ribonucleotide reductase alpha subunit
MEKILNFFDGDSLAANVWAGKYKYNEEQIPTDMFKRHIKEFVEKEYQRACLTNITPEQIENLSDYGQNRFNRIVTKEEIQAHYTKYLNFNNIVLAGSPMQGIGRHELFSSLSNCFVLGQPYDSYSGINKKEDESSQIAKRRGGVGLDLSTIRPAGASVHNQASFSSGVVIFAEGYSNKTLQVAQEGRRGALMLSLIILHPDSLEFIVSKQNLTKITGANISVAIPDEFMEAVETNSDILLRFPVDADISFITQENIDSIPYGKLIDITDDIRKVENAPKYIKKIKAVEYWLTLIECAWQTAEPGILFTGNWRKGGTDWEYKQYRPISTNPCFSSNMSLLTKEGDKTFAELEQICLNPENKCNKFPLKLINKYGELKPGRVWRTGVKHVINLILENRVEVTCTSNHLFELDDDSECKAKDTFGKFIKAIDGEAYEVVRIVDNDEVTEVFDFELKDDCHWGVVQGLISHNCSEIPMSENDACRLMSVNLYKQVIDPFTENARIDKKQIYQIFYEQLVITDLLIDLEIDYIDRIIGKIKSGDDPQELIDPEVLLWEKIKKVALSARRCGAGFTALGDMLAALNLQYAPSQFVYDLFHLKMEAELDATIDLSILYNPFDGFDPEIEKLSVYNQTVISKEFPKQYEKMLKHGRRNVSWSTAAPTGSLSIMTQTTSGIEPLFKPYYKRRKKCILSTDRVDYIDPGDGQKFTEFFVLHPKFIEWFSITSDERMKIGGAKHLLENLPENELNALFEQSPWFGNCADDLHWKSRVAFQSLVQKFTTHAISSTINLPKDIEKSVIGNIYMESWKKGLKGNTVYRDGSRAGILVDSDKFKIKLEEIENTFVPLKTIKRPKTLEGHYHTLFFRNKVYSIIIGLMNKRPYELFIISEVPNLPQVIGETHEYIVGEVVKESKNWYNFVSDTFLVKEITDVEHDEKMISILVSGLMANRTKISTICKILDKTKPIAGSFTNRLIKIINHYIDENDLEIKNEVCQECGGTLRYENGCVICENGHSKC